MINFYTHIFVSAMLREAIASVSPFGYEGETNKKVALFVLCSVSFIVPPRQACGRQHYARKKFVSFSHLMFLFLVRVSLSRFLIFCMTFLLMLCVIVSVFPHSAVKEAPNCISRPSFSRSP